MGGKPAKRKGDKGELEVAKMFGGERTYYQPGEEKTQGDVKFDIPYLGQVEVKRRKKTGFKQLYDWLEGNDALFVRSDYHKWLVVMPAEDLKRLLSELDEIKTELADFKQGAKMVIDDLRVATRVAVMAEKEMEG